MFVEKKSVNEARHYEALRDVKYMWSAYMYLPTITSKVSDMESLNRK